MEFTKIYEMLATKAMAKEFLESRLGIEASNQNVVLLARYISSFEKRIADRDFNFDLKVKKFKHRNVSCKREVI